MTELGGKNWDLSLYELHRTPQEAITDSQQITISPKVQILYYSNLHNVLFCIVGSSIRVDMSHLSGDVDKHHDNQGVSSQILCGVHHNSPQIWQQRMSNMQVRKTLLLSVDILSTKLLAIGRNLCLGDPSDLIPTLMHCYPRYFLTERSMRSSRRRLWPF